MNDSQIIDTGGTRPFPVKDIVRRISGDIIFKPAALVRVTSDQASRSRSQRAVFELGINADIGVIFCAIESVKPRVGKVHLEDEVTLLSLYIWDTIVASLEDHAAFKG